MKSVGRASRILTVIAAVAATIAIPASPSTAFPALPTSQEPTAYLVADAGTGAVLAAKNEHAAMLPASTIKILTALAVLERLPIATDVPVSALAAAQPAMKINMTEDSVWPLDQALHSMLIVSANDAAYALAERASGSIDKFAVDAQATATYLGMKDTTFKDPAGLDDRQSFGGGSRTSAYDLAVAARNALAVPEISAVVSKLKYEFTDPNGVGRELLNHNKGFLSAYPGATGMKTGFTEAAGRTLVTTATRNGRTLIAVVMGTWDDSGWASFLLDQGFSTADPAMGAKLPKVKISTADSRLGALSGLPAPLGITAPPQPVRTVRVTPTTLAKANPSETSRNNNRSISVAKNSAAAKTVATQPSENSGGGINIRNIFLIILVVLIALFFMRRRAVKKQRARRLARQRALALARRRRMIDVVEKPDVTSTMRALPTSDRHPATSRRSTDKDRQRSTAGR